jgi:hypothetical protein
VVWFQGERENACEFAHDCSREQAEGRIQEVFDRALRRGRATSTGSTANKQGLTWSQESDIR